MAAEIIVIDMTRDDGSRFTTAVRDPLDVKPAIRKHGGASSVVSHWKRNGYDPTGYRHPLDGWNLQKRDVL